MKQVLFLHSAGAQGPHQGSGQLAANLQSALGDEYNVVCPIMPNPEDPSYGPWREELQEQLEALKGEVLLIGHSLGGSVLLKYLSEHQPPNSISGLFLVASPFWGKDEDWQADEFDLREDFAVRLAYIPNIFFYHSRDDEVVPVQHLRLYAASVPHATVRELDRFGHAFIDRCHQLIDDISSLKT